MTVLTETYLGNQETDPSLQQQVLQAQQAGILLEVYLQPEDSGKGRIHAFSTTGIELGIITAISFQTRHKLKYKTLCGASPCDPSCGGFDRVLL
jgi:urease accessory protein